MIILSAILKIFFITEILEDTFAPPIIAVTGFFGVFKNLLRADISACSRKPGALSEKCFVIACVEACFL